MTDRHHQRRQIKRMSLADIQAILRVESGTPNKPGDRARRYLLWRRLDRIIRCGDKIKRSQMGGQ
jgi:hypothetical protein